MAITLVDPFDGQMPFPLDLRMRKADINGRNSIPTNSRYPGMLVWTDNEQTLWILAAPPSGVGSNSYWVAIYPSGGASGAGRSSLVLATNDVTLNWSGTATGPDGSPVPETWAQLYGNTPVIQVWLDTGSAWSLEVVPVTHTVSGGNIASVTIETGSISSRIIIK